jgi:hypothetical protein
MQVPGVLIMPRQCITIITLLLAASLSSAVAQTYSWTDEKGTMHFTEDPGSVPRQYREKALRVDLPDSPREEIPPSPDTTPAVPDVSPATSSAGDAPALYAGKTYDQWEKELRDREAAMTAVLKRINRLDSLMNKPDVKADEGVKLMNERLSLQEQFTRLKNEYNQMVEAARKGGLVITIEK